MNKHWMCLPVGLTALLALTACGSGEGEDVAVDRQAAGQMEHMRFCIDNQSSLTFSSTGDGSPSSPEGFVVEPGESDCVQSDGLNLRQNMMTDTGPSWPVAFYVSKGVQFSACDLRWLEQPFGGNITCGGNPVRIDGRFERDNAEGAIVINVKFSDP